MRPADLEHAGHSLSPWLSGQYAWRRRTAVWRLVLLVLLFAMVGCAPEDPYRDRRLKARSQDDRDQSNRSPAGGVPVAGPPPQSGELGGRAPKKLLDRPSRFPAAGETPQATLQRAAHLYGNWTAATAGRRLTRMAALSVGQARAELRQTAAQASVDRQQRETRSLASVEAVVVRGQGQRRRGVVVTRELVRAPDLPAEGWRFRVTMARVVRRGDGWLVSEWAPQP